MILAPMRQLLLVVDVQPSFSPPDWLVQGIRTLTRHVPAVAMIELHDEQRTPFQAQLGWRPATNEQSLIETEPTFIKHGYAPPPETIAYLRKQKPDRVLVCGVQTDTCVLAAGFALFDAGFHPTLIIDLTVGSSLDRTGKLGIKLWGHHFGKLTTADAVLRTSGQQTTHPKPA